MRVISIKRLRDFWMDAQNRDSESPLRTCYRTVNATDWTCFADVRLTYPRADLLGNKVIFDIGGNKYRLIVVIDYEGHKVFVRHVLTHNDYDKGHWKKDTFGMDWKRRPRRSIEEQGSKERARKRRGRRQDRRSP
jgi:mRNA interferase HigB